MLEYKNYHGFFEFDDEAETFHGRVIGIKDMVTFQGSSVAELKQSFQDSIDEYLDFCQENGDEPNKPFSGKFLLRISSELHRSLDLLAAKSQMSMNSLINEILSKSIKQHEAVEQPTSKSKSSSVKNTKPGKRAAST